MSQLDAAALADFRMVARSLAQLPRPYVPPAPGAADPAVAGSLFPDTVRFRFACLAVKGGPCPAWRLSECRRCWRRPKVATPVA